MSLIPRSRRTATLGAACALALLSTAAGASSAQAADPTPGPSSLSDAPPTGSVCTVVVGEGGSVEGITVSTSAEAVPSSSVARAIAARPAKNTKAAGASVLIGRALPVPVGTATVLTRGKASLTATTASAGSVAVGAVESEVVSSQGSAEPPVSGTLTNGPAPAGTAMPEPAGTVVDCSTLPGIEATSGSAVGALSGSSSVALPARGTAKVGATRKG